MGQIPQDGNNGQNVDFVIFSKLYCDQTVLFFQLFSTDLKRFCPLDSKNVSVLVLAYLEPELELFEVWEIMVLQIIANVINYINNLAKYSINTAKT